MQLLSVVVYCIMIATALARGLILSENSRKIIEGIAVTGVVGMFLISGVDKLLPPQISGTGWGGSDVSRLGNIYSTRKNILTAIVLTAGVVELVGSACVMYGHYFKNRSLKRNGLTVLSGFTLVATLAVYANPWTGIKKLPVISNINTIGGILALWS